MPGDQPDPTGHVNWLDASGSGDIVQARNVHGGVHFHRSDPAFAVTPSQLPGDVRGFVNRNSELAALDTVVDDDRDEPLVAAVTVITGTAGVGKPNFGVWHTKLNPAHRTG